MASTQKPPRRGAWEIGAGDPATVLAEARKALFVMVGFIAVIWIVQLANWADHYQLSLTYGIRPRDAGSLPDIVTALVILTSGLGAWLTESSHSVGAGASGLVFGYLGYILVRGIFDRHPIDLLIGAVMALCFAYQFSVLLPQAGIGWQAHIGGLVGGILAGWLLRDRRAAPSRPPAQPGSPGRSATASPADGPRADLHKQLDDLGL